MSNLVVTTVPVVFEDSESDAAYDKIDHLLRGSLDDSDYAEYSAALDIVAAGDAERMRDGIQKVRLLLMDGSIGQVTAANMLRDVLTPNTG